MRHGPPWYGILILIAFLVLIDFYVFTGVRTLTSGLELRTRKIVHWIYWGISIAFFIWLTSLFLFVHTDGEVTKPIRYFLGFFALLFVPKLVFGIFLLGEDVFRMFRSLFAVGHNMVSSSPMKISTGRRKFVGQIAMGIAAIPFLGIIHGLTFGKFKYRVLRETLYYPDLPDAFDGFTITQLSDIHVGSFDTVSHREEIKRGIALANEQKSDLFVFTGDLVNNKAREMEPWMDEFSALRSPYGQFSILGNHDYGDYINWDSAQSKENNMQRLYVTHAKLGFTLLRNEHAVIEKDGQKIYLIGVENWGKGGFTKKGDLDIALRNVPADGFKILLSHDPSHFDKKVSVHPTHIPLTLSGHTHGGQFGVEIPWLKFSPIQMNYPHWAGLYNVNGRNLYVNRGFGFLAFPMRVGVWPEITVLTLKKGTQVVG